MPAFPIPRVLAAIAVALATTSSGASVVTFGGADPGAGSADPHPNASAAAAGFDAAAAALGTVHLVDFESAPKGAFSSLEIAPGVVLTGSNFDGNTGGQQIRDTAFGTPDAIYGYDTTVGGSTFDFVDGGFETFTFATPIVAFGAFIAGTQFDTETLVFSDGSVQTLNLPSLPFSSGGAEFLGFTDAGRSVSRIVIDTRTAAFPAGDFISLDDLRYVTASAVTTVPEPASALLLLGALGLCGVARRKAPPVR